MRRNAETYKTTLETDRLITLVREDLAFQETLSSKIGFFPIQMDPDVQRRSEKIKRLRQRLARNAENYFASNFPALSFWYVFPGWAGWKTLAEWALKRVRWVPFVQNAFGLPEVFESDDFLPKFGGWPNEPTKIVYDLIFDDPILNAEVRDKVTTLEMEMQYQSKAIPGLVQKLLRGQLEVYLQERMPSPDDFTYGVEETEVDGEKQRLLRYYWAPNPVHHAIGELMRLAFHHVAWDVLSEAVYNAMLYYARNPGKRRRAKARSKAARGRRIRRAAPRRRRQA